MVGVIMPVKHPGDPSPKSPADVLRDKAYRLIDSEVFGMQQFVRPLAPATTKRKKRSA